MSQILGSNSYIKITSSVFDYNAAYTVLLHYRVDTAPTGDYATIISISNDGEAALSDTDIYQINPFPSPKVHRINVKSNSSGSTPGGSAAVTATTWYNPVMIRTASNAIRGYLGSATETSTATNNMSGRSTQTNFVLGAVLGSGGASQYTVGTLHSCKIWTTSLTTTELDDEKVQVEPVKTSSLYGWWFFDNSSDKWVDRSGNGHNFTLVGTSTYTSDKPSGVTEPAGNQSVSVSDSGSASDTTGISVGLALVESGSGSDSFGSSTAASTIDSGTGTDISIPATVSALISDTVTGVDLLAQVATALAVLDSGIGNEAISATVSFSISDFGSETDAVNILMELTQAITDSGFGVDIISSSVSLSVADSAIGNETANATIAIAITDNGSGSDTAALVSILLSILDNGSANDVLATSVNVSVSETGISVDVAGVTVTVAVADTSSGTDGINLITETLKSVLDSVVGADSLGVTVTLNTVDSGLGADSASSSTSLTITDSVSSIDTLLVAVLATISDFASGIDSNGGITVNIPVTDMATGVDVLSQVSAVLAVLENGSGVDVAITFNSAVKIVSVAFSIAKRLVSFVWRLRSVEFFFTQRTVDFVRALHHVDFEFLSRSVEFSLVGG